MIAWLKRIFHMDDASVALSNVPAADGAEVTVVAAVEVDLDKLKALLNAYGHTIGDEFEQFVSLLKK